MKKIISLLLLAFSAVVLNAQSLPEKPSGMVNDYAGFFSSQEKNKLEQHLQSYYNATSTQIFVVSVHDFQGMDKAMYATELGHKWAVGTKGKDNGVIILIKPKTAQSRGEIFIATGYGMEHLIPDAVAKRIVENDVIPYFKQGQNFNGVAAAITRIEELAAGEYTNEAYMERTSKQADSSKGGGIAGLVFFVIIYLFIFRGMNRTRRGALGGKRGSSLPFWIAASMMSSGRSSHSGSFGNFSSGGGSFGGFGGGMGGGFGGGGAGGSW